MKQKSFEIGQITRPKGLDGTVKINFSTSDPQNLLNQKQFIVGEDVFNVKKAYIASGCLYLTFEEIKTIEEAEKLKWKKVFINRESASKLSKSEFYEADLIGAKVFFENGEEFGKISEINNYGAASVATFKTMRGEFLCPIVDGLIKTFSNQANIVTISEKKFKELTEE